MINYKNLLINKRALSNKQLIDSGFPFTQYKTDIPSGEKVLVYIVILVYLAVLKLD